MEFMHFKSQQIELNEKKIRDTEERASEKLKNSLHFNDIEKEREREREKNLF